MATTRPYAFNTGDTISGTTQYGNIAFGPVDYFPTNDLQWWMGPDEDLGYLIVLPVPDQNHPTPIGDIGEVRFRRSEGFTEESFLSIANMVALRKGHSIFTGSTDATDWLSLSGFPTNYPYEFEAVSLFDRMDEQPSDGLKTLINTTIKDLKDEGIWYKDDVRYQFNLHTQQASNLNWKGNNNFNITAVNSPVWIQFSGYTGATGTYLKTNHISSNHGKYYQLYDCGIGVCTSNEEVAFKYFIGSRTSTQEFSAIYSTGTPSINGAINGNTSTVLVIKTAAGVTKGIYDIVRCPTSGTTMVGYYNGEYGNQINVSVGIVPSIEWFIMCFNNIGSPALYSLNTFNYARIGGSLTPEQISRNEEIVQYFNNNVGLV